MNIELIKVIGTIIVSLCGSGGLIMWFLNRYVSKREDRMDRIEEGIRLGLENDAVIFKALREHKINGESEAQEEKMNTYFRKSFIKS